MPLSAYGPDVLPPELIREIQKHWRKGLLWIPDVKCSEQQMREEEDERALVLMRAGMSAKEVAECCNMTIDHVYYLSRRLGEKSPYSLKARSKAKALREALKRVEDDERRKKREEQDEQDERALALVRTGMSAKDVAACCNMSPERVYFLSRRLGEKSPYSLKARRKAALLEALKRMEERNGRPTEASS